MMVETYSGIELSRRYSVIPSVGVRIDVQCAFPGVAWNAAGNLFTTNRYYTSGPNQFALKSVVHPDGTMTVYNYFTNTVYQTNIVVTGQPDSAYDHIVDGSSNVMILNQSGNLVSSTTWDVKNTLVLARDLYGNYDVYGRPQQVSHLDGTVETNIYACCGLANTVDKDGVAMVYLYDTDKRQYGYQQYFNSGGSPIAYQNTLDAAGRKVVAFRIGTDSTSITQGKWAYDTAGRLIAQTNALGGVTTYVESTDPGTGGRIRTATNPDGGTRVEAYYADGSLKSVTGTAIHGKGYGYGVANSDVLGTLAYYAAETNLLADGTASSEWTKTFTDTAGRTIEVLYADGSYSQFFYNSQGQLAKQIDPDGLTTLYQYNAKGQPAFTSMDMDQNGTIDFSGNDHITWTTNDVTIDHSVTVRRSRTYSWAQNGVDASTLISVAETSADGLNSWQIKCGDASTSVTNQTAMSYSGSSRTGTVTAPDGSYKINTYSYGRLISSTNYDSMGVQIASTSYSYDAHGRQQQVTDARNGATIYGYNNADKVTSVTTPAPGSGQSAETTTTVYDSLMRPYSVTQPDGTIAGTVYLLTGELGLQYGSRTYPVGYHYDYAGRMQTMTNWSSFSMSGSTGARVTRLNYDSHRGWLTSKVYNDGNGPSYSYTAAGRMTTRVWARGVTTAYAYDNAGSLTNILYSGATASVTNTYDRFGRQITATWNGITDTMSYNLADQLLTESFTGGLLNGLSVTNGYDKFLRRTDLTMLGATLLSRTTYSYDNASRLATADDGNGETAAYTYHAKSPLVSQITFKQSGTTRMTTSKQYDYLNRLTSISSQPSGAGVPPVSFAYNYNAANQRTQDKLADGSYWIYQYDSLGQMTSGIKYFYDGTPVPGQQFDYNFDTIGNRTQTQAGGDAAGSGLRFANYTVNSLNQITARDYPGTNDVIGAALATNAVTVNGQMAWRKGEYFWSTVKTNNNTAAQSLAVTVSSGGTSTTGNLYNALTPEHFGYDLDGNLTNDGRWAYTWDAENRLVQMTINTNVGPQYQLTFEYDAKGRRIQKLVVNSVALYTNRFLYDGWNIVGELKPDSTLLRSYVWGIDVSGSMQGAGGVGGLLVVSYHGSATTNCVPAFDGNGNVSTLANAADGMIVASYEYGPFGEVIRYTKPQVNVNPILFSTKYTDDESDLAYYGYRYYKASTGTWSNRDPNAERGFTGVFLKKEVALDLATYSFVANNAINLVDYLGLKGAPSGPAIHCENPCQWARDHKKELGLDDGTYGVTLCCDGQKYACVVKPGNDAIDPVAKDIITDCIMAHENSHTADPNVICTAKCGWTGPNLTTTHTYQQDFNSECDGYNAEINCLTAKKSQCNGNRDCEAQVDAQIANAQAQADYYCGMHKKYPN